MGSDDDRLPFHSTQLTQTQEGEEEEETYSR